MNTAVATTRLNGAAIEKVLLQGDLSKLTADERLSYYQQLCESVGLNPLTCPLEYVTFQGKLKLYARKECTEQLRKLHGVSITDLDEQVLLGVYRVKAHAKDKDGRTDCSIGAVAVEGLKGEALANALMKAETKSKRRVTLSICGLGFLDETEVETIPGAVVQRREPAAPVAPALPSPTVYPEDGRSLRTAILTLSPPQTEAYALAWVARRFGTDPKAKLEELTTEEADALRQAMHMRARGDREQPARSPGEEADAQG